jgi:peptide/nickel transport system ATP-binding protein
MSQPLFIDIQNLNISFGGKTVVSQLNLQLKHGESIAFVGESGSGKTVTARSLLGLQDAKAQVTAERFLINGEDMRNASQRRWRKIRGTQIGYVLQARCSASQPKHRARRPARAVNRIITVGRNSRRRG